MGEPIPFEPSADDVAFAAGIDAEVASRNRNRRGRADQPSVIRAGGAAASASQTPYRGSGQAARDLPHSLEAEEGVIAAVCIDADHLGRFIERGVNVRVFFGREGGEAWAALCYMLEQRLAIDAGSLYSELVRVGKSEAAAWVLGVSAKFPTSAEAESHARQVVDLALRRRLIRVSTEAAERAYTFTGEIEELAAEVSEKVMGVTGQRSGLPAPVEDEGFDAKVLPEPPMLIEGVFHRGRRVLLLAPSKASKTWTAMHMSAAIASGRPWMGFKTHKSAVLHIDLELPEWDLKKRRTKLRELLELPPGEKLGVTWWALDGHQRSIDELLPLIVARAPHGKFGLIVIEPAYVILGKRDENDNADVTDFMNRLAWLARLSGAAVLCTHHFAKGDASKKEAKDRASGAGSWVRAPDTAITLTPLDEQQGEDCYKMEFIERSMKRHAPVGVQFEYPVFRTREGLDLNALREAGRPRESTEKNIVELLMKKDAVDFGSGLSFSKIMALAEGAGMSRSTAKRRLEEAVDVKRVSHVLQVYFVTAGEAGVGAGNGGGRAA